jgi:hypothetical protein
MRIQIKSIYPHLTKLQKEASLHPLHQPQYALNYPTTRSKEKEKVENENCCAFV